MNPKDPEQLFNEQADLENQENMLEHDEMEETAICDDDEPELKQDDIVVDEEGDRIVNKEW